MDLKVTRQIIDCIHDGTLEKIKTKTSEIFGFNIPEHCPGVPDAMLFPKNTWSDPVIKKKNNLEILNFMVIFLGWI